MPSDLVEIDLISRAALPAGMRVRGREGDERASASTLSSPPLSSTTHSVFPTSAPLLLPLHPLDPRAGVVPRARLPTNRVDANVEVATGHHDARRHVGRAHG